MNFSIYDLNYILGNVLMTYTIYKFMKIFYTEKNTSMKIEFKSYYLYFVIITILHLFVKIPLVLMISNLVLFFLLTLNYKSSFKKRLSTTFLIYATLMSVETLFVLVSGHLKLDPLIINDYRSILGITITRVVSYFVVLIIGSLKNINKDNMAPTTYWLLIVMLPVSTLYLLVIIFMNNEASRLSIFISTTLVFLINFGTFYLYDDIVRILQDKADKKLMGKQNEYYENQLELMKTSLKTTKIVKHDLKNHMACIYALAESNKNEELLDYISEVMEVLNNEEISSTGNVVIDSIINFKLQGIEKEEIDVTIYINIPKELKVPSFDVTVILGNLLDNALNAVKKLEKDRYINIKMKYTKGRLILNMENSFDGKIIKREGIIHTSHRDKRNHGLGLESVKKVLTKYDGTMDLEYDDRKFNTSLLMYVD